MGIQLSSHPLTGERREKHGKNTKKPRQNLSTYHSSKSRAHIKVGTGLAPVLLLLARKP
ncbi:MAG: hypothetical protein OEZ36_08745 [Spirochaetota bacterium]|nr:hypothetical protein [Spirochaetota bacterium]